MFKLAAALVIGSLALAGCGVATASASGTHTTSETTAGHSRSPAGSSTFAVQSMTFVSDQQGFALGTAACGSHRCEALLGTTNGGATWRTLTAPVKNAAGPFNTCPTGKSCVSQVRFATKKIGYAFDPSLYLTTDGGTHWTKLTSPTVSSLEVANGNAVRVAYQGMGCGGSPYKVQSAPIGSNNWRNLAAPNIHMICPPVLYRQGTRLVLASYGNPAGGVRATAEIARSTDGGAHWIPVGDKCGGKDGYTPAIAIAPPNALTELCRHQMPIKNDDFGQAWVKVSSNDGASFGPNRLVAVPAGLPTSKTIGYQIAEASPSRLLVIAGGQHLSKVLLSSNGGHSWSTTLTVGAGNVLLVGFEDQNTARIAAGNSVWTTRDGGTHWTLNHF